MSAVPAARTSGAAVDEMASRAVDPFDLASHLESQGYGDRYAHAGGFESVFDLAADALQRAERVAAAGRHRAARTQIRDRLVGAASRSVALVAGVVVCLATVGGHAVQGMALAGGGAWLGAHLMSVVLWRGLSTSRRDAAAAGLPVLLAGLIVSVAAGALVSVEAGSWIAWGCASAVLSVLVAPSGPLRYALVLVAAAALTQVAALRSAAAGVVAGDVVMGLAVAAAAGVLVREGGRLRPLPRGYGSTLGLGVVQAGGQILAFVALLGALPPGTSTWIAVGGLVASAMADPALELVQVLVRGSVTRATSWVSGHRALARWTITTVLSVVVVAGLSGAIVARDAELPVLLECGFGTAALAAVTVCVGALLRGGDARGAAVAATGAAAVMGALALCVQALGVHRPPVLVMAVTLCVLASVVVTRRVLTHPALW